MYKCVITSREWFGLGWYFAILWPAPKPSVVRTNALYLWITSSDLIFRYFPLQGCSCQLLMSYYCPRKAQWGVPTPKLFLFELQCNSALWNALGNTLAYEGPWKAPVVLFLPRTCDSYRTKAINPGLVSCEKRHTLLCSFSFTELGILPL